MEDGAALTERRWQKPARNVRQNQQESFDEGIAGDTSLSAGTRPDRAWPTAFKSYLLSHQVQTIGVVKA